MAGCGYVGIVTGTCLANLGNDVICFDIDEERISNLRTGIMPFFEPSLRELVESNSEQKRLMFTIDSQLAIENSDIIFIAVGTPDKNGEPDLSGVFQVADSIAKYANGHKIVVVKSTVPVGTCKKIKKYIAEKIKDNHIVDVVSNPEFLREGEAIQDFMVPDRIVIGTETAQAREVMNNIYKNIERTNRPILHTDIESSELIKYASNAMLACRISFMNNLAELCEKIGADVKTISKGIGLDKRIGSRFLQAGIGYGGSCFPKDIKALIHMMKEKNCFTGLLDSVEHINENQKKIAIRKVQEFYPDLKGKIVALWGLSFKPKTDDIRCSPAVEIIKELKKLGATVKAFDIVAEGNARTVLEGVEFSETPFDSLEGAHVLLVATEWDLFRQLDKQKMKETMAAPNIIDGRNMYSPEDFTKLGFNYVGIGR